MKRHAFWLACGLSLAFGVAVSQISAQNGAKEKKEKIEAETSEEEASKKEYSWDKGPAEIDVSKYPAEQQANYKIFAARCSKCHTLARAINSDYVLPEEWEPYVKKMQKKKRSGITPANTKKIIDFLIYDSKIRKKDLIEKKLKEKEAQKQKGG